MVCQPLKYGAEVGLPGLLWAIPLEVGKGGPAGLIAAQPGRLTGLFDRDAQPITELEVPESWVSQKVRSCWVFGSSGPAMA